MAAGAVARINGNMEAKALDREPCASPSEKAAMQKSVPAAVILYPIVGLDRGGAQIRSLQLLREVKKLRPDVRIVVYDLLGRPDALDEAFRASGVELIKGCGRPQEVYHFWRFCRHARPTVLHANIGVLSGYLLLVAFMTGVSVRICHFRSTRDRHTGFVDRYVKRAVARLLIWLLATKIVGVCHSVRRYSPARDAQWLTIYNGIPHENLQVELSRADSRRREPIKILALGRIHQDKRFWRFAPIFDALRALPGQEKTTLHIVGAGAPEDDRKLQRTTERSTFRDSIFIHGETVDPMRFFRASDVLLLPSAHEGLPGTAIEALSVGTPVVSADLPGVREIASHIPGVSVVGDGADVAEWARTVEKALATSDRHAIIRAFHDSPFLLGRYVADIMQLWGVGAEPPGSASDSRPDDPRARQGYPGRWATCRTEATPISSRSSRSTA
jgi:glycosyltransferase involved in cell wall biosynthesis